MKAAGTGSCKTYVVSAICGSTKEKIRISKKKLGHRPGALQGWNIFAAHLILFSITNFLALSQSMPLAPALMVLGTFSGTALIFGSGKWFSGSIPRASHGVLVSSLLETSMIPPRLPCLLQKFFCLVNSGILFMDSQKLFQLLTVACLIAFLYRCWASERHLTLKINKILFTN